MGLTAYEYSLGLIFLGKGSLEYPGDLSDIVKKHTGKLNLSLEGSQNWRSRMRSLFREKVVRSHRLPARVKKEGGKRSSERVQMAQWAVGRNEPSI